MSYRKTVCHSREFDAPVEALWNLLTDWAGIIEWMPDGFIRELQIEGSGEGAVRHLVTGKGVHISERLDRLDRNQGLIRLSILDPLPWGMLSYSAAALLEQSGEKSCRLAWCGTFELPDGGRKADELEALLKKSYATMFKGIRSELERTNGGIQSE